MSISNWIQNHVPELDDPAPNIPGVRIEMPDNDTMEVFDFREDDALPLEPVFTVMDYTDASGTLSRRRVTFLSLLPGPNGPMLRAQCHERRALRTFRFDRIGAIIDDDGVAVDAVAVFRDVMEIDVQNADAPLAPRKNESVWELLGQPAVTLLVGLAACDGRVADRELAAILCYLEDLAAIRGIAVQDVDKLEPLLRRIRPNRREVLEDLDAFVKHPGVGSSAFFRAAKAVILADGEITEEEVALFEEFASVMERAGR